MLLHPNLRRTSVVNKTLLARTFRVELHFARVPHREQRSPSAGSHRFVPGVPAVMGVPDQEAGPGVGPWGGSSSGSRVGSREWSLRWDRGGNSRRRSRGGSRGAPGPDPM